MQLNHSKFVQNLPKLSKDLNKIKKFKLKKFNLIDNPPWESSTFRHNPLHDCEAIEDFETLTTFKHVENPKNKLNCKNSIFFIDSVKSNAETSLKNPNTLFGENNPKKT